MNIELDKEEVQILLAALGVFKIAQVDENNVAQAVKMLDKKRELVEKLGKLAE